jgi:hypothetical protein
MPQQAQINPLLRPGELRASELAEQPFRGPFGGIQSELPPDAIDQLGFVDASDVLFYRGLARSRPQIATIFTNGPADDTPVGFWSLFASQGNTKLSGYFTDSNLVQFLPGPPPSLLNAAGPVLTAASLQLYSWTVVNYKLCFANFADPVMAWDGMNPYSSGAGAPIAGYVTELDKHLLAGNCIEASIHYPQRIHWSAAGDPLTWLQSSDFTAGQVDLLNELGPITGMVNMFQTGYAFQYWGIVQIIPTGVGANPFNFVKLTSKAKGCVVPYSLATYGEFVAYVGRDNVFLFDGTNSEPIGDQPLQGASRIGARSRIFADLALSQIQNVQGMVSTTINGHPYNAYWLNIPNIAIWVYNFDEFNWTRFVPQNSIASLGELYTASFIRIEDLIGTIAQQTWSPATLQQSTPFDVIGFGTSDTISGALLSRLQQMDFTGYSENGCSLTTGQLALGDQRHRKTIRKLRFKIIDQGSVTFVISVASDSGYTQSETVTIGTGSGMIVYDTVDFNVSGYLFTIDISSLPGAPFYLVEFTPIFEVGSELQNNQNSVSVASANISNS